MYFYILAKSMSQSKNKLLSVKVITSSISVTMSLSLVLFIVGLIALIMINTQRITGLIELKGCPVSNPRYNGLYFTKTS